MATDPKTDRPDVTLAAGVVLFDEQGRVLLVHQDYGRRRWTLPGGRLEPGESPGEAAIREVREEVNFGVRLDHLIGVYFVRRARPGLSFAFAGRVVDGEFLLQEEELDDFGWFAVDELPDPCTESAPLAIADAASGRTGVYREIEP